MKVVSPDITIIMATYNRAHFIIETLNSIREQSFVNWECLIIDDGSTDDTKELIYPILSQDLRFKYLLRPNTHNKGLPGCRNFGLGLAQGDYIVFFDDDDIVHPDNLNLVFKTFKEHNVDYVRFLRNVFVGKFSVDFNRSYQYETQRLGKHHIEEITTGKIPFNSCQVVWKKTCFEGDFFNETLMYAEEWECYLRILTKGAKGVTIDKVLFFGRKHPQSNTGEFWNEDPIRMESKVRAVKLVINNLKNHNLLSHSLIKYFLQLGFMFKKLEIINYILMKSEASISTKLKYKLGFIFYPIIKPVFNLKSKF